MGHVAALGFVVGGKSVDVGWIHCVSIKGKLEIEERARAEIGDRRSVKKKCEVW